MKNIFIAILLTVVLLASPVLVNFAVSAPLKAAIILPGTKEDGGWNTMAFKAAEQMKKELGIQTAYSENVTPADATRVAREYIKDGYQLIFFHGMEFQTQALSIAEKFPQAVTVMHTAEMKEMLPKNVWAVTMNFYQNWYALGVLAGLKTKTNKIGVVGGIDFSSYIANLNAIRDAACRFNPGVKVYYSFCGTFDDPIAARKAAESQIDMGVDVILNMVDLGIYGVVKAAKKADSKVWLIGMDLPRADLLPENFIGTSLHSFGDGYTYIAKKVIEGMKSGNYNMRPGQGMYIGELNNISSEIKDTVLKVYQKIEKKSFIPAMTIEYIFNSGAACGQ